MVPITLGGSDGLVPPAPDIRAASVVAGVARNFRRVGLVSGRDWGLRLVGGLLTTVQLWATDDGAGSSHRRNTPRSGPWTGRGGVPGNTDTSAQT